MRRAAAALPSARAAQVKRVILLSAAWRRLASAHPTDALHRATDARKRAPYPVGDEAMPLSSRAVSAGETMPGLGP